MTTSMLVVDANFRNINTKRTSFIESLNRGKILFHNTQKHSPISSRYK